MEAVYDSRYDLIVSETTLSELAASVETKPYLSSRISTSELREFAESLRRLATVVPEIPDRLPAVTRDPADDYLIAHTLLDRVDCLVTGDKDLLVLERIGDTLIVAPAEFLALLEAGIETSPPE